MTPSGPPTRELVQGIFAESARLVAKDQVSAGSLRDVQGESTSRICSQVFKKVPHRRIKGRLVSGKDDSTA